MTDRQSGPPPGRFTIADLLVANVFVAILLAAIAVIARARPAYSPFQTFLVSYAVGLAWSGLATVALRPGATRDFCRYALLLLVALAFTAVLGLDILIVASIFPSVAPWRWPVAAVALVLLAWGALLFVSFARAIIRAMMPRPCPSCARRGLILANLGSTRSRCLLFTYEWCARCGARLKRRRIGATLGGWLDASTVEDDPFFLGTRPKLLRRLARRGTAAPPSEGLPDDIARSVPEDR